MLLAEGAAGRCRIREAQYGEPDRARQQGDGLIDGQRWHPDGREAALDRSEDLNAERLKVEGVASRECHDERHQGHRYPGHQTAPEAHGQDDEDAEDYRWHAQVDVPDGQREASMRTPGRSAVPTPPTTSSRSEIGVSPRILGIWPMATSMPTPAR